MALLQWVNLPKLDKFKDSEIDSVDRCGSLSIEIEVDKADDAISYKAKVTDDGTENVVYETGEIARNANFKLSKGNPGIVDKKKIRVDNIQLPSAGGNKYKIEIQDASGNVVSTAIKVETRRKLYFQVVKMKDMKVTIDVLTSHLISEFWNPDNKHFIKLEEIKSKGDISGFTNFDEHQQAQIPILTKSNYAKDKDPFCFVLVLVGQLAASERKDIDSPIVTVDKGKPVIVNTVKSLWLNLDKEGSSEEKWVYAAFFEEDGTGKIYELMGKVTASGKTAVSVDTSALPDKVKGVVKLDLKLVNRFRTGLSFGKNVICVATIAWWEQRDDDAMKSTLVHEAGHKIGMVPDGNGKSPKKQTTYYYKKGGHCNHGTNKCVMYGSIHGGRKNRFCTVCSKSVRKLDLDASQLPGFRPL
ncbi:MAG: hypothetical protein IMF17_04305 [Proteobacteria bacterium]|nr:hypothetical protein [Pseudomonadota bacterium]